MSQSEIERLRHDTARDPALLAEVEKLTGAPLAAFAASRGYDVSAAEIGSLNAGATKILTDEQLDAVAGGKSGPEWKP